MEVKPEVPNGPVAAKTEVPSTPQGPKKNFQQGGPNQQKKKNFQNRNEKVGNSQGNNGNIPLRNNNRGPMKNEVIARNLNFQFEACYGRHLKEMSLSDVTWGFT